MFIISTLYSTILDALFPLSAAEKEILSLTPNEAVKKLSPAPPFYGLAVELPSAQSVFAYKDKRVSKLVWHIKYKKSPAAIRIGGFALHNALISINSGGADRRPLSTIIIPIPITSRRRKERGYNQCELLLDEIERLENESELGRFTTRKDILVRVHHDKRQTLKGRADRVKDAEGIFDVNGSVITDQLKNSPIVIIDDVITTGSTLHEAIRTMENAGFTDVRGLSLAH